MSPEQEGEAVTTECLVYIGRRVTTGGKVKKAFCEFEGTDVNERTFYMLDKAEFRFDLAPGTIIEVTRTAEKATYLSGDKGPRFFGKWEVEEDVLRWQIADRAAYTVQRSAQLAKRATSDLDVLKRALKPIKDAYRRASSFDRPALLQVVIEELLKP